MTEHVSRHITKKSQKKTVSEHQKCVYTDILTIDTGIKKYYNDFE